MSDNNNFYTLWNENLDIVKHSLLTGRSDTISYDLENAILDKSEIVNSYKNNPTLYRTARLADYPETWPLVDQMQVDDMDRIWVSVITDDENHFQWFVMDENKDQPIGTFKWPGKRLDRNKSRHSIRKIKDGYLYAFIYDSVSSMETIKKFQIEGLPGL